MPMIDQTAWRGGGCHCGGVRFEVALPPRIEVEDCNCSICRRSGYLHLIVPRSRFRLVRGGDLLTTYQFNTQTARHTFCRICGVKSFYTPRSNPDGYSVNLRCLDAPDDFLEIRITPFDGRDRWEENAALIAGRSADGDGSTA
jgi:hypothetical protein